MIKNIIFDLSEVIISGYIGIENEVEKDTGIKASEFLAQKSAQNDVFLNLMRGRLTEEEYFNILLANTNWDITSNDMKIIVRKYFNQPILGTIDIIKRLKKEYRLILLSDYVKEWQEYILQVNKDLNVFDEMYFSSDYGKLKSDENTFKFILEQAKLKPEETLFIDDSNINIKKAQEQGLNTILFTNAKELEQELTIMKILKEEK